MLSSVMAVAQNFPYELNMFDKAIYYGMYQGTVDEPVPAGAIRNSNSSYGKKLTQEQLNSFGNTLTMTVTLNPLCDNYDRIGKVNLAFVEKDASTYVYDDVERIEIGRFITPFMNKNNTTVQEVPYVFEVDNLTKIFHDEAITSKYDLWIELEVYGYQGDDRGGAVREIAGCAGRSDVYMASLDFVSNNNPRLQQGPNFFMPIIYYYELKNYTLDGTDVLGQTVKTVNFTLEEDFPNAKLYLITSNHGANAGGEEYVRRQHRVSFNDERVLTYTPGGVSCEPFRKYNTQANGIYGSSRSEASWRATNNWCPGDKIPTRVIELGDLKAGEHSFKIEVPNARFVNNEGYFPMSVYMQGGTEVLSVEDFATNNFGLFPNPVTDIATITSSDKVNNVLVYNTLGQVVLQSNSNEINFSSLESGIYIVKAQLEGDKTITRKVVKK